MFGKRNHCPCNVTPKTLQFLREESRLKGSFSPSVQLTNIYRVLVLVIKYNIYWMLTMSWTLLQIPELEYIHLILTAMLLVLLLLVAAIIICSTY